MSRNGSGTYTLPAGNPVVTGTTISSTWANNTLSDMATALTQSIAYDGQTTPVANLPMGTYAHTGVGNATARTMYASAAQVEDGTLNYLTSVAGTNAITATAPVSMSAYVAGQTFRFIAAGANTGAVTLNLNAIGAKAVTRDGTTALVTGDIVSGGVYQVVYDGTQFQLTNSSNASVQVTSFSAGTTGLTPSTATTGAITLGGTLGVANGGTGLTSLTSGYIPYGNGTSALSSTSNLFWDSANARLGIGTNVPGTQLGVGNATDQAQLAGGLSGATSVLYLGSPNNGSGGMATLSYVRSTGLISLGQTTAGGSLGNFFNMDYLGNVGIGTSSPGAKLQVSSGQAATAITSTTAGQASYVLLNNTADSSNSYIYCPNKQLGVVQADTSASSIVYFSTQNTERMRIDSSGNVGIGTSSPATKFQVVGTSGSLNARVNAGNTGLDITPNDSTGVTDLATTPLGAGGKVMTFTTYNGSSSAERMRIDSSGNVLVGCTSVPNVGATPQQYGFSVSSSEVVISKNITTGYALYMKTAGGNNGAIGFWNGTTQVGSISTTTTNTAYNTASDYRLKENVQPMAGALDVVSKLKPVTYDWIADGSKGQGFIAHELQAVVPGCVTGEKDAIREEEYEVTPAIPAVLDEEGNIVKEAVPAVMGTRTIPVYQGIDTSFLVATLTAAIQELSAKVTALEAQLTK